MSELAVAKEYFEYKRNSLLDFLALEEPELDKRRRDAVAYFDCVYGDKQTNDGSVRNCIAAAFVRGEDERLPFSRASNSHLKVHVHPECPYAPNAVHEMSMHSYRHPWEWQRSVLNIDLNDTDRAIQEAHEKWKSDYRDKFNRRNSLKDNHLTLAYSGSVKDSSDFIYDRSRVLETIARTGTIHWGKLKQLFELTKGINVGDEIEVSGAYMEYCVAGASNGLIALWEMGLYVPFQYGSAQGTELDEENETVLLGIIHKYSLRMSTRCKLGVVFDSLGAQMLGQGNGITGHLFDPDISVALPELDSVLTDLENFTKIKSERMRSDTQ